MYSQHEEEQILAQHLPTVAGRFLDIGAFHPKQLSNTRALYERGWSGVVVEPSPGPARSLVEAYGSDDRVAVVCAAVGYGAMVEMHATDAPVTTDSAQVHSVWAPETNYYGKFWAPVVSIEALIDTFGPFDFVDIDTEGSSVDLLQALLQTPMQPACICVEHDNRAAEIMALIAKYGYRIVWGNGTNQILVKA